ncbi:MAG: FTR1 family protein [Xanthomonadales bacterium]|nr:FTR1 family protein [Xanthomonadales bacterium]
MLLMSVILILQETLEAAMLVSILAAVTLQAGRHLSWLPWGFAGGCIMAFVYAANIQRISEWFDFVGQELTNAALQATIAAAIVLLAWRISRIYATGDAAAVAPGRHGSMFQVLCALIIGLAVTREGSEILVYLGGFLAQSDKSQAVLTGSAIGFGIGLSVGLLLFHGLLALGDKRWIPFALLGLFCGNMLAQSALQLTQADWLQPGPTLWDSSAWLSEHSVIGRLLYALLGYEANPSTAQVIGYLTGAAAVLAAALAPTRSVAKA